MLSSNYWFPSWNSSSEQQPPSSGSGGVGGSDASIATRTTAATTTTSGSSPRIVTAGSTMTTAASLLSSPRRNNHHHNNHHHHDDAGLAGGGDHNSTVGGTTLNLAASSFITATQEEELLNSCQTDDEVADKLLTQFPTYGTCQQQLAAASNSRGTNSDWFGGGSSSTTTTSTAAQQQQQQQLQTQQQAVPSSGSTSAAQSPKSKQDAAAWDYDEQQLWKTPSTSSSGKHRRRQEQQQEQQEPTVPQLKGLRAYVPMNNPTAPVSPPPIAQRSNHRKRSPFADYYDDVYDDNNSNNNNNNSNDYFDLDQGKNSKASSSNSSYQVSSRTATAAAILQRRRRRQQEWVQGGTNTKPSLSIVPPDLDIDEKTNSKSNQAAATAGHAVSSKTSDNHDRQHWMPDQLCKQCYACDTPFTVFRRRHHCRICGQVFCNACSAYFVPYSKQQQPQQQQQSHQSTPPPPPPSLVKTLSQSSFHPHLQPADSSVSSSTATTTTTTTTTTSTVRVCKMCYDQVTQKGGLLQVVLQQNNSTKTIAGNDNNGGSASGDTSAAAGTVFAKGGSNSVATKKGKSPVRNKKTTSSSADAMSTRTNRAILNRRMRLFMPETPTRSNADSNVKPTDILQQALEGKKSAAAASQDGYGSKQPASSEDWIAISPPPPAPPPQSSPLAAQHCQECTPSSSRGSVRSLQSSSFAPSASSAVLQTTNNSKSGTTTTTTTTTAATASAASTQSTTSAEEVIREGNRHLGLMAATHLEKMAGELLRLHAPLLWQQLSQKENVRPEKLQNFAKGTSATATTNRTTGSNLDEEMTITPQQQDWIDQLLTLATRACATVNPDVKNGDLLDIRPYCKTKVIPGGSVSDCAYISGILFRKTVSHKRMAKQLEHNPRIMLLSGAIEFAPRTEHRMTSLETLFEQEEKYTEILVGKILKLKPDILLVGRSVSRRAQELLLKANVILLQHVKAKLLQRISRQTGATIISSTDHVMNQFGASVLGKCCRFRLVTFRDNEIWMDDEHDLNDDSPNWSPDNKTGTAKTSLKSTSVAKQQQQQQQEQSKSPRLLIGQLLADPKLSNPQRQAALAANKLGHVVLDGVEAIKSGLSKRGVTHTYCMLEGCRKDLGCTMVLRGASRAALKQVKVVFRFLLNVAYNLRLECSYLKERCARLSPDYHVITKKHTQSSSLCVDYGQPPPGRKVTRPWCGGGGGSSTETPQVRPPSGQVTAFDHQGILITSIWMTDKTQCCPAEVKGICYYSLQDVALGQFLRDSCFNLSLKCQNPNCKKSVLDHSLSFVHNDGLIHISVEQMERELPSPTTTAAAAEEHQPGAGGGAAAVAGDVGVTDKEGRVRRHQARVDGDNLGGDELEEGEESQNSRGRQPIATWTYCKNCCKVVTPLVYISDNTWKFSFGKFLEVFFYNRHAIMNGLPHHQCSCQVQSAATLYFGCGKLAARFSYESVRPFGVFVRKSLPPDVTFQKGQALRRLELISSASSALFVKFDKHIERVSREARKLFNTAINRPEHLQTVLSELTRIGSEVDHAAKTLQEKIASVSDSCRARDGVEHNYYPMDDALFRFPQFARRYLFMLTSAWNEKLSAAGQAIAAMRRLAGAPASTSLPFHRGEGGVIGPAVVTGTALGVAVTGGDVLNEELQEGMKRLRQLNEHYARYNVTDITQVLPSALLPGSSTSQQQQQQQDGEYDDEFYDDPEGSIDFSDGIDADVLASRRRLRGTATTDRSGGGGGSIGSGGSTSSGRHSHRQQHNNTPTVSLGTRRAAGAAAHGNDHLHYHSHHGGPSSSRQRQGVGSAGSSSTSSKDNSNLSSATLPKPTPGGAVKSAITRFFNRGGNNIDPYVVDLGIFNEGRPRLSPGVNGVIVPVVDEQLSTIIAYSLASSEYAKQFKHYSKLEPAAAAAATSSITTSSAASSAADVVGGVPTQAEHTATSRGSGNKSATAAAASGDLNSAGGGITNSTDYGANGEAAVQKAKQQASTSSSAATSPLNSSCNNKGVSHETKTIERQMLVRNKSHIKHTFRDFDEKGMLTCKFVCTTFWATQFHAVRQVFLSSDALRHAGGCGGDPHACSSSLNVEQSYVESLSMADSWAASGGKSGASFARTSDDRFVIKCISRTELQMFLDCAPAYFEYLSQAFFHGLPTVLCKIVGVYQIGVHNRVTGKRSMEQVAVMQNIFCNRKISKTFDLKGSLRGRFAAQIQSAKQDDSQQQQQQVVVDSTPSAAATGQALESSSLANGGSGGKCDKKRGGNADGWMDEPSGRDGDNSILDVSYEEESSQQPKAAEAGPSTLLDGDFLEFNQGRPMPMTDRARAVFQMSILNDTLFLSIINVLDYSILVGVDEQKNELVVGIIDFMRQYDILKQMERVGKSLPMVVGSEAPTIIQPPLYKARFTDAMERYFMAVPSKWTAM